MTLAKKVGSSNYITSSPPYPQTSSSGLIPLSCPGVFMSLSEVY